MIENIWNRRGELIPLWFNCCISIINPYLYKKSISIFFKWFKSNFKYFLLIKLHILILFHINFIMVYTVWFKTAKNYYFILNLINLSWSVITINYQVDLNTNGLKKKQVSVGLSNPVSVSVEILLSAHL